MPNCEFREERSLIYLAGRPLATFGRDYRIVGRVEDHVCRIFKQNIHFMEGVTFLKPGKQMPAYTHLR
jgi:hypothetical protein